MEKVKSMGANARQVGGDHYSTGGTQHWDMFGPEYLIGCATKYVARWRKKNGVQDLEKALHYAEKLIEMVEKRGGGGAPKLPVDRSMIKIWAPNQGIEWPEVTVIEHLMFYDEPHHIREAIDGIKYLISTAAPVVEKPVTAGHVDYRALNKCSAAALELELKRLRDANLKETGWGAAVGARLESIREIECELRRRRGPRVVLDEAAADAMKQVDEQQTTRKEPPDADESRPASLYPWHLTNRQVNETSMERWDIMRPFYRQMGIVGGWRLDTLVTKSHLPRELQACYALTDGCGWRIRIEAVPDELRDEYPRLARELSRFEFEERPRWEQQLYTWEEGESKYRLRYDAWGAET